MRLVMMITIAALATASPVLENPHVRAYRITDGSVTGVAHGPGVVISIDGAKAGNAVWVEDAALPSKASAGPGSMHGHRSRPP